MRSYQRSAMNRCFATHKHSWILNINESTILKFNHSDSFVLTTTLIYKNEYNEYEYNVDIEHSKYVWFICLLMQIHTFRKILLILINDSSDSNHSLKITVFVVVAFTKKKEEKDKDSKKSKQIGWNGNKMLDRHGSKDSKTGFLMVGRYLAPEI